MTHIIFETLHVLAMNEPIQVVLSLCASRRNTGTVVILVTFQPSRVSLNDGCHNDRSVFTSLLHQDYDLSLTCVNSSMRLHALTVSSFCCQARVGKLCIRR